MAKTKYTLYLDESITHSGSQRNQIFCMAGIIIKDTDYSIICNEIDNIKTQIWHDQQNPTINVIHQKEVNEAQHGRLTRPEFARFRQNRYCKILYDGLNTLLGINLMIVVGSCINLDNLNRYFCNGIKTDKYLVALQLVLENFCHFLCLNNGVGEIVYESRNEVDNERMRTRFYNIKLMGSMYIDTNTMIDRLTTIRFFKKEDNNIGLQVADFSPNYFARLQLNKPQKRFNIDNELRKCRYDGGLNLRDRFGVKNMP